MKNPILCLPVLFLLLTLDADSQELIHFQNPSFEGHSRPGDTFSPPIEGWSDCGIFFYPKESPPDLHPVRDEVPSPKSLPGFGVTKDPIDGESYLGMVTRYNETWESVSQELAAPLKKDSCYKFSVWLCRSNFYYSKTRRSQDEPESFLKPIALFIWGGHSECEMWNILASVGPVINNKWTEYTIIFSPKEEFTNIVLQAYYHTPDNENQTVQIFRPYNGHILIDNLSPISQIACD
jgi:hypothetical protein